MVKGRVILHTDYSGVCGPETTMLMLQEEARKFGLPDDWLVLFRSSELKSEFRKLLVKDNAGVPGRETPLHVFVKNEAMMAAYQFGEFEGMVPTPLSTPDIGKETVSTSWGAGAHRPPRSPAPQAPHLSFPNPPVRTPAPPPHGLPRPAGVQVRVGSRQCGIILCFPAA